MYYKVKKGYRHVVDGIKDGVYKFRRVKERGTQVVEIIEEFDEVASEIASALKKSLDRSDLLEVHHSLVVCSSRMDTLISESQEFGINKAELKNIIQGLKACLTVLEGVHDSIEPPPPPKAPPVHYISEGNTNVQCNLGKDGAQK